MNIFLDENKPILIGGIITIVVVAIILLVSLGGDSSDVQTVSVKGEADVSVVPDVVSVNFNVETNGSTAVEAKDANSDIIDRIMIALLKEGFDREDISTQGFNVYEDYEWQKYVNSAPYDEWAGGNRVVIGFKATHSLRIEIPTDNTQLIGKAIDAGIDNGALLQYINFELSGEKENEYKAEATLLATQNAKMQAEAMAEGLGMKLGGVVSIKDASLNGIEPYRMYDAPSNGAMMESDIVLAKSSVTSIQPGKQKLYASISVVYKLKNKGFF